MGPQILFLNKGLRNSKITGMYEFKDRTKFLEILRTYQQAVPKEKSITYVDETPREVYEDIPNVLLCEDGIRLRGLVSIDGENHRTTIGAIIYRPNEILGGLYLVTVEPRPKPDYKIEKIEPNLLEILGEFLYL